MTPEYTFIVSLFHDFPFNIFRLFTTTKLDLNSKLLIRKTKKKGHWPSGRIKIEETDVVFQFFLNDSFYENNSLGLSDLTRLYKSWRNSYLISIFSKFCLWSYIFNALFSLKTKANSFYKHLFVLLLLQFYCILSVKYNVIF